MGIGAQISSTVATIEDTSQGSNCNEHALVPSAPPAESSEIGDSAIANTTNNEKANILAMSDNRVPLETHEEGGVNNRLLNDNLVLEPETTGIIFQYLMLKERTRLYIKANIMPYIHTPTCFKSYQIYFYRR